MKVTNLCTSPNATVALKPDAWRPITTVPKTIGTTYWCSVYLAVTGGTIMLNGIQVDASKRIGFQVTATDTSPMSLKYTVKSGSPTVKAWNMLLCTLAEYQANKTLLDSIEYFDGDTMPRA